MDAGDDWEVGGGEQGETDQPEPQTLSQLCLWSMILGILSPLCCGCLTGIPAVILGHMGLSAVGDERGPLKGRGFAIAGLILGYLSIVLTLVMIVINVMSGGFEEIMREIDRNM